MHMYTEDYLKKALLDTQERVRDFMNYADHLEDNKELHKFFKDYALSEGEQAQKLQSFIRSMND